MVVNKTSSYLRNLKKLKKSHKEEVLKRITKMEEILMNHDDLQQLSISVMWKMYKFEKLIGDKKGIFSVRLSQKYRLEFKPVNEPGYEFNEVVEVDLIEVSDHYSKL